MATTRKLMDLFRAIATEDLGGATAVATQICKSEEHKGHRSSARLLRGALFANGRSPANGHSNGSVPHANGTVLRNRARITCTILVDVVKCADA